MPTFSRSRGDTGAVSLRVLRPDNRDTGVVFRQTVARRDTVPVPPC